MPKKYRLKSQRMFSSIFKKCDFVKSTSNTKLMFKKNDVGHSRIGIACSKKNNSVRRNKIKRIVREFMRTKFPMTYPYDIVVYVNLIWENRKDSEKIRISLSELVNSIKK